MKVSLFRSFGAMNSVPVFNALEHGLKKLGHQILHHDLNADVYVIWSLLWQGRMQQNKMIWDIAKTKNIPVIILEVGMLNRGITWRIGINGFQLPIHHSSRSKTLRKELKPWSHDGDYILICGQNPNSELWSTKPTIHIWLDSIITDIRQYTDMNIIFRPHPRDTTRYTFSNTEYPTHITGTYDDFNYEERLHNAWVVISPSSNPGPLAVISGKPVITDQNSLAYEMSTTISNIMTPNRLDREEWFERICDTEWTIDEIKNINTLDIILTKLYNTL
jgi:hypothetical protein